MVGILLDNGFTAFAAKIPFLNTFDVCYQAYVSRGGENAIFFAFPLVLVGTLFAVPNARKVNHSLAKVVVTLLLMFGERFALGNLLPENYFDLAQTSVRIFLPAMTYFLLAGLLHLNDGAWRHTKPLREMSSVIYLIHFLFISQLVSPLWFPQFPKNKPLQYLFVCAASCIFAVGLIGAGKKFPILKRLY